MKNKCFSIVWSIYYLSLFLIIQVIVNIILSSIVDIHQLVLHKFDFHQINMENIINRADYVLVAYIISGIVTFYLLVITTKERAINLNKITQFAKVDRKVIIASILLAIAFNIFDGFLTPIILKIFNYAGTHSANKVDEMIGNNPDNNLVFYTVLFVGIVSPVVEEILCRGFIYYELRKTFPVLYAIIIQSIMFGAFHMNPKQFISAFLAGIVLALLYEWFHSLWVPIVFHGTANMITLVLNRFSSIINKGHEIYRISFFIVSFAVLLIMTYYLWKRKNEVIRVKV